MQTWKNAITGYLDSKGYAWEFVDGLICFSVQGDFGKYPVFVMVKGDMMVTIAKSPFYVPDVKCLEMAHFLHLANFGMLLGNFEMDCDEGDIRFKTCLFLPGQTPSNPCIARYVFTPAIMLEKYAPGVKAILSDGALADLALTMCES